MPLHLCDQQFVLCCYGSQPRSLLLSTSDNLFQADLRVSESVSISAHIEVCYDPQDTNSVGELVTLLSGHKVTCLSRDISHPFRVLVATEQALFLVDTRQPTHQLLAVQHQLSSPPVSLSCLQTHAGKSILKKPNGVCCVV